MFHKTAHEHNNKAFCHMLYLAWLKLVAMGKGQRNNDSTCIRLCNSASRSLTTLLNRREQWKMSTSTGLEITTKIWVSVRKTCLSFWISPAISGFPVRKPKFKAILRPDNSWISGRKPWSKNWVSVTNFGCPGHPETQ